MTEEDEHRCSGTDDEMTMCLDGVVYGPCVSEYCYGACEYEGFCLCECGHVE